MILIINTSGENNYIALYNNSDIYKQEVPSKKGVEVLLPAIESLLKQKKITLSALTVIAVDQGPGSFTGLRIGITTANTLANSLDIPIFGFHESSIDQIVKKSKNYEKYQKFIKPVYPIYPKIL